MLSVTKPNICTEHLTAGCSDPAEEQRDELPGDQGRLGGSLARLRWSERSRRFPTEDAAREFDGALQRGLRRSNGHRSAATAAGTASTPTERLRATVALRLRRSDGTQTPSAASQRRAARDARRR